MSIPWEPQQVELQIHARIAQAVATGMNQLLPPEFRMSPNGYLWWTSSSDGPVGGFTRFSPFLNDSGQVEVKRVEELVENNLEGLQVAVTEILTVPWPPVEGKPLGYFAGPYAEWSEGKLRFWFATDKVPVTPIVEVPLVL